MLARLQPDLQTVARLLPYEHFQAAGAINGLDGGALLGLLAASAVMALLAWWRFERRDVRVVGEGEWRLRLRAAG
jgi:ABC-2 type transport system permease protein